MTVSHRCFGVGQHVTVLVKRASAFRVERQAHGDISVVTDAGHHDLHIRADQSGPDVEVRHGRTFIPLAAWLDEEPPLIRFHDGAQHVRDLLISAPTVDRPFDDSRIDAWDWTGVDLTNESQHAERRPDSIQRRIIEHLDGQPYDIVFDDDTNETADIIPIRIADYRLLVGLFHCNSSVMARP